MGATSPRWQAITDSEFPWEREALAFVRDRLPDHDPYRAWANFEFIADDGSINEVDLLVLSPKGYYLVEIKSRPGTVEGDQGTWTWRHDGRLQTVDNPLLLANRKTKKLISLLRRQPALRKRAASPFLEAHVFLSHEDIDCRLTADLRERVHRRDTGTGRDERSGIVAALTRHSAGEERSRPDPLDARSGDELEHGLVMKQRLGKGSTALALLVERDGREHVLKVALSREHNDRLHAEADVMRRLRHQCIVELHDVLTFHDGTGSERVGLLMARAGEATLADRLRDEGRLHLELLERFGEDLLATIDWLEQKGIPHRDIKPENLGTAKVGNQLHLMLFDFSLARTPAENILAGTRHYLDPFLQTRKPPRWDTHAERFAAAVTLYQMASGSLPRWGDGQSEPAVLDCEATIEGDAFEPAIREDLAAFFEKALRRDYRERFDNAEEMLRAWRHLFLAATRPETDTEPGDAARPFRALEQARLDTLLGAMGLSARAMNAVERMGVRTVQDLLRFPLIQVNRMRGVGNRTRRELTELARRLAERLPTISGGYGVLDYNGMG